MKSIWKHEVRRAVMNPMTAGVLLFECALAVMHFIFYGIGGLESMELFMSAKKNPYRAPYSLFVMWMGGNNYNLPEFLRTMLLPLLAALPYGGSYYEDLKSGFIKNVYCRTKRLPYLKAKYKAAFLSGTLVAAVPLCLNMALMAMLYPATLPQISSSHYAIFATDMWYRMFYTHPFLYNICFLLINMMFGGLVAVSCLAFTFLTDYKYIVLMFPFVIQMFLYALGNLTGHEELSPVFYLQPGGGIASGSVIVIELAVFGTVATAIYFFKGRKDDVY